MADSFASGLSRGIQNAMRINLAKAEQEDRNKMAKLQGQLVELQLKQQQQKDAVLSRLNAPEPPVNPQTGMIATPMLNAGQPAPPKKSISERLAELSFADLNAIGVDPTKIQELQQQADFQKIFSGAGGQGAGGMIPTGMRSDGTMELGLPPTNVQQIDNGDGTTSLVLVNRASGTASPVSMATPGTAMPGQPVVSGQPTSQEQIPINELQNIIDVNTGRPPPIGTTRGQLQSGNYIPVSEGDKKVLSAASDAEVAINQIDQIVNTGIFPETGQEKWFGYDVSKLSQATENFRDKITAANPDINIYETSTVPKIVKLIRAMGEVGAMAEGDVERGLKLVPQLFPIPDSKEVATRKMSELRELIMNSRNNILRPSGPSIPAGVDPADWPYMSPEQRALFGG